MPSTTYTRRPLPAGLVRCGCGAVLDDEDARLPCVDCRRDEWEDNR